MLMKQATLRKVGTNTHMVTWIEDEDSLKQGCFVTSKGCEDKWEVLELYERTIEKQGINRSWLVGGF